jgi:anti-anti-sigma factor
VLRRAGASRGRRRRQTPGDRRNERHLLARARSARVGSASVPRDPFFSLDVRSGDAGTVVTVAGELDVATAPELAAALADVQGDVTVDLNAATFADPSGLRVLLAARAEGCRLRVLRRGGGPVARLLALTGTERLLRR